MSSYRVFTTGIFTVMSGPVDRIEESQMKGLSQMNNRDRKDKTMSSREIAELTGKNHSNVMRDVEAVEKQLKLNRISNDSVRYVVEPTTYTAGNGEQRNMFQLNKSACEVLMMGYSMKCRIAVHHRWQELEAQQQFSLPGNYVEALEALVVREKGRQVLAIENSELKPQAKAFEALTKVSGIISISDYHKLLQSEHGLEAIQKDVRRWLNDEGYIFKRNWEWDRYAFQKDVRRWLNDEGYIFKRNWEWDRYASHNDKFEEKLVPWSNNRGSSWVVYLTKRGIKSITPKIVEALR